MSKRKPHNRKKTPVRKAIGLKVRMKRCEIGIAPEELAEKADLHPAYLGFVERGEGNVALENIIALARALGCSSKGLMPD